MSDQLESPASCHICEGSVKFWNSKNNYNIFRCQYCGFGFVFPQLTQDQIREIYKTSGHGAKFDETSLKQVLEAEHIYPNSTIDSVRLIGKIEKYNQSTNSGALDVGAGYGFYSKELTQRGYEVIPLELAFNERRILAELAGIEPVSETYENFDTRKKFGVILMSQILEHAADPVFWVRKTYKLLDKGGLWIIAVPHFNSWSRRLMQEKEFYIIPPEHLNYFTKKSLCMLLEDHGFELLEMETISRLPWHKLKVPGIKYPGNVFLQLMDTLGLGMMLNAVARKV